MRTNHTNTRADSSNLSIDTPPPPSPVHHLDIFRLLISGEQRSSLDGLLGNTRASPFPNTVVSFLWDTNPSTSSKFSVFACSNYRFFHLWIRSNPNENAFPPWLHRLTFSLCVDVPPLPLWSVNIRVRLILFFLPLFSRCVPAVDFTCIYEFVVPIR